MLLYDDPVYGHLLEKILDLEPESARKGLFWVCARVHQCGPLSWEKFQEVMDNILNLDVYYKDKKRRGG